MVVVGAGGHAKVVVATALAAGFVVRVVIDDDPELWGGRLLGIEVRGPVILEGVKGQAGVLAIGDNRTRKGVAERLDLKWTTVVHPSAIVHSSAQLGEGTVVFAGAVIQPETVVGRHAIINTGASVDHDCILGDFVHVAPGARLAGDVVLDEGVLLGIGSCTVPGVRVGAWARIGAGGAVICDLPGGVTAVGAPARSLGSRSRTP